MAFLPFVHMESRYFVLSLQNELNETCIHLSVVEAHNSNLLGILSHERAQVCDQYTADIPRYDCYMTLSARGLDTLRRKFDLKRQFMEVGT